MRQTWNREERERQKTILRALYTDYNAPRHDVFVDRYNSDADRYNTARFMAERNIITEAEYNARIALLPANWVQVRSCIECRSLPAIEPGERCDNCRSRVAWSLSNA